MPFVPDHSYLSYMKLQLGRGSAANKELDPVACGVLLGSKCSQLDNMRCGHQSPRMDCDLECSVHRFLAHMPKPTPSSSLG